MQADNGWKGPIMTRAAAEALYKREGPNDTNLCFMQADNGLFLIRNKGVNDDGTALNIQAVARIVG